MEGETGKYSGFSIASLVMGILSIVLIFVIFISWIFTLLAIIFGFVSLKDIKKNNSLKGRGLAITGIVLGFISVVIMIVMVVSVISLFSSYNISSEEMRGAFGDASEILLLEEKCSLLIIDPISCDAETGVVVVELVRGSFSGEMTSALTLADGNRVVSGEESDFEQGEIITLVPQDEISSSAVSSEVDYLLCADAGCVGCSGSKLEISCA